MLAHRIAPDWSVPDAPKGLELSAEHVADFTELILQNDQMLAAAYIEARRADGTPLENIFLDLMAPSARLLGDYWDQDYCDFTQVTMGLSILQQMLRKYSPAASIDGDANAAMRQALVMPAPGEQHTFGISMVEEFMRSGGWMFSTILRDPPKRSSKWSMTSGTRSLVCLCSHESSIRCCRSALAKFAASRENGVIGVMVGGPFFIEHPELIENVGADTTAVNGPDAVVQARTLVHRKQSGG